MKTTFIVRHMQKDSIVEDHFEERAQRLNKHLEKFEDDLLYLHGTLDKNPHKDEFYATLTLYLPSAALHCHEKGADFTVALNAAFLDIARQLEKRKDKLNKEKRRRRRLS